MGIHNAGASRKVCQEHLNKAKTLLAEAKNLLAAEIQKKKERTEIRAKEHAIFLNEKEQYDQAIAFMKEFIQMVADKFGGNPAAPSFIQFSEGLLRKTSKIGKFEAAVPVLIMMSQYVAEAKGNYSNWSGSDASKTLVTKLNALLDVMEADLEKIVNLENKRQADFNAFLIKVNKNIDDLRANIKQLLAQIKSNSESLPEKPPSLKKPLPKLPETLTLRKKPSRCVPNSSKKSKKPKLPEELKSESLDNLMNVRFGKVP